MNNKKLKTSEVCCYKLSDSGLRGTFIAGLERDMMRSPAHVRHHISLQPCNKHASEPTVNQLVVTHLTCIELLVVYLTLFY